MIGQVVFYCLGFNTPNTTELKCGTETELILLITQRALIDMRFGTKQTKSLIIFKSRLSQAFTERPSEKISDDVEQVQVVLFRLKLF